MPGSRINFEASANLTLIDADASFEVPEVQAGGSYFYIACRILNLTCSCLRKLLCEAKIRIM